jgi:UMF1 family MFS transporter
MNPPVKKREIFGWACFDFANSSFTTIIITVVFAVYFQKVIAGNAPEGLAWWGWALALSQLVVILLSPWLGAVADVTARKKWMLGITTAVCVLCTAALGWMGPGDLWTSLVLVALANVAFSLGENFCAGFLPELSGGRDAGRISGYGWSFGYLGGLASLGLALAVISGENGVERVPWTFPMTALFFLCASLPTFLLLRERARPVILPDGVTAWRAGWSRVAGAFRTAREHPPLGWFLANFTLLMAGLSAVIAFAALFADQVLHMTQEETIGLFASLQVSSAVGAFAFGFLQDKWGSKNTLLTSLALWIVVCVWGYFCGGKTEFFIIGNVAGLGIGSLQSSCRAVVSKLAPAGREAEVFGYWGLFGKLGAVLGTFCMGTLAATAGFREAVLCNGLFFLVGGLILLKIRIR